MKISLKEYLDKYAGNKLLNNSFVHSFKEESIYIYYGNMILKLLADKTGYRGITLFKKIILFDFSEYYARFHFFDVIILHELVHIRQQQVHGFFIFIVLYLYDFFKYIFKGYSFTNAYMSIRFEKEAYNTTLEYFGY